MPKTMIAITVISLTFLAGCASNIENVQRETARSIGGDVMPSSVIVKDIDRHATSVNWSAETPKGAYVCSADDMMRRVLCVKKPTTP